jgi:hypothetical protein
VRQGGILSPRLFALYMDNLSHIYNKLNVGCCINERIINHLMYADDLVLFAPSVKGLQKIIDIAHNYGTEHNIIFNETKTVCMCINDKRNKEDVNLNFYLGDKNLSIVDRFKYLGHIIQHNLSDNDDIIQQMRSVYVRANTICRKFSHCSDDVKRQLFLSYCCNIYCCQLWCKYSMENYNKIKTAYNNSFRILFGLPRRCSASEMFVSRNMLNYQALIRKSCFSILNRISSSKNIFVQLIVNSDIRYCSLLFVKINNQLYT